MTYNTKNLKDLEYSIYALQSKASGINEKIKKYSKTSELKSEEKNKILTSNNKNINFIRNNSSDEKINNNSLEGRLENEVLELKKKQKKLILALYITILLILFSLVTIIELNLFLKI